MYQLSQAAPMLAWLVIPCAAATLVAAWSYQLETHRARLLAQQRDFERSQAVQYLETDAALRVLRHDLRNHLSTVRLLVRDDPARAMAYLDELEARLRAAQTQPEPDLFSVFLDAQHRVFRSAGLALEIDAPAQMCGALPCGILLACALDAALGTARPGTRVRAVCRGGGCSVEFLPVPLALRREMRALHSLAGSIGAQASLERRGDLARLTVTAAREDAA